MLAAVYNKCSLKAAIDQQPHKIALIPCAEAVPLVKLYATCGIVNFGESSPS